MQLSFSTIALPTRPQPDTIVAIFILKKYGAAVFPGIEKCAYKILPLNGIGKSEQEYMREGTLLLDVGGGIFDHHNHPEKTTASNLVAEALGIKAEPSLKKLLAYAERDDFYGKGTQSDDPLDKAFGLSGLIAALNKTHSENIALVIETVLPLIAAHHSQEHTRFHEIPKEIEALKKDGKFEETEVAQKKNKLSVCFIESDSVQLPGYLRSADGGKFDLVVQRRSSGHVNILTRPLKRPDLRMAAQLIRGEEYFIRTARRLANESALQAPGRNEEVPEWYFDPATNSLQNGGINPAGSPATKVAWADMKELVRKSFSDAAEVQSSQPPAILYTALFVDDPAALLAQFPPRHAHTFAHHSTNEFKPKDLSNCDIGRKDVLKIIGRVSDEKGDALLVENTKTAKKHPHITLSCAEGTRPAYSDEMMEKAYESGKIEYFPEPVLIAVTEGYLNGQNVEILSK
ncbi:MAG: hypothetical protein V4478_00285 [Patescibacteria group bacterium]